MARVSQPVRNIEITLVKGKIHVLGYLPSRDPIMLSMPSVNNVHAVVRLL